ncbi:MAG TPA: hypothetical protein VHC90_23780 [Bryobacteraceae bacterium]|nr:hypothetical protein [Bryobacteraceae bacterium]
MDSAAQAWASRKTVASASMPGVELVIARMTFARRLELMTRVRDLAARLEYFDAAQDGKNRMEASLLGAQMDRLYLGWGLDGVLGLSIDGEPATPESLVDRGPEPLVREALAAIRAECGLSEAEIKN